MLNKFYKRICCFQLISLFALTIFCGCSNSEVGDGDVKINVKIPKVSVKVGSTELKYKSDFCDAIELSDFSEIVNSKIFIDVGNLNISYNTKNQIIIKVAYHASASSEKDLKVIINETKLSAKVDNGEFNFEINKKDSEENIWKWLDKNISKYNLSANVEISVPNNFSAFNLKMDTGNIEVDGLKAAVSAITDTGCINAKGVCFTGDSNLTTDTGNINVSFDKIINNEIYVKLFTDTGNILINTNQIPCDISPRTREDSVSTCKSLTVDEKCKIKASVGTGSIEIN